MAEMKCACGGTFQFLGEEYLRTGEIHETLMGGKATINDWNEEAIPGELYVCDGCRELKFCVTQQWLEQRREQRAKKLAEAQWAEEWEAGREERMIQSEMKDLASCSIKKLEKIVENQGLIKYSKWEQEAARRLLEEKREPSRDQRWKDWN